MPLLDSTCTWFPGIVHVDCSERESQQEGGHDEDHAGGHTDPGTRLLHPPGVLQLLQSQYKDMVFANVNDVLPHLQHENLHAQIQVSRAANLALIDRLHFSVEYCNTHCVFTPSRKKLLKIKLKRGSFQQFSYFLFISFS